MSGVSVAVIGDRRKEYVEQLDVARNALGAEAAAHREDRNGGTYIMRVTGHRFFSLTLFLPHAASTPDRPHALVSPFLAAAQHVVGRV